MRVEREVDITAMADAGRFLRLKAQSAELAVAFCVAPYAAEGCRRSNFRPEDRSVPTPLAPLVATAARKNG
jgi:hypothetical protein